MTGRISGDIPITLVGCGYIGKLLAQQLLAHDRRVTGFVSSDDSLNDCSARGIPCEKLDLDEPPDNGLEAMLPPGHATIYLVPPPRTGTRDTRIARFLDALESRLPGRFVLISTTGVYGDCKGAWVDETAPLNPTADRARRRSDAEHQAQVFCERHSVPLVILRVPGIYGPGRLPLQRIRSGEPIVRREDAPFTNRIHAHDLVNICEQALLDTRITGIYNAGDGTPGTMADYFNAIADAAGLPRPPSISLREARDRLSAGMLSYMAESRRIDNSKLLRDFGIRLQYPDLQTGLKNCF